MSDSFYNFEDLLVSVNGRRCKDTLIHMTLGFNRHSGTQAFCTFMKETGDNHDGKFPPIIVEIQAELTNIGKDGELEVFELECDPTLFGAHIDLCLE